LVDNLFAFSSASGDGLDGGLGGWNLTLEEGRRDQRVVAENSDIFAELGRSVNGRHFGGTVSGLG
jgi:hypothetical protein